MVSQFHEIEEVAGLGPIEECKDLVGSELLHSQRRAVAAWLGWQGSVVDSQIDLTPVVAVTHLDTHERWKVTASGTGESCAFEGSLQCITQLDQSPLLPWDREIVEVTRWSVDKSSNQETAGSSQSETASLRKPADDSDDPLLERRQQDSETPRWRSSHSAQAWRTFRGRTSSSHRSISSSA